MKKQALKGCLPLLALMICLLWPGVGALAAEAAEEGSVVCLLTAGDQQVEVHTSLINDEEWLFLPAFADTHQLEIHLPQNLAAQGLSLVSAENGERRLSVSAEGVVIFHLEEYASEEEDGVRWIVFKTEDDRTALGINLMHSENLRALFLFSDDPVHQGRKWLEDCPKHENVTSGSLVLVSTEGDVDQAEKIEKMRGRGNATWDTRKSKLPYQIKLAHRRDLLNLDTRDARNKKYVLLAELYDETLLNNLIGLSLARVAGIAVPHFEPVDLYYDGEYRGYYLLCEKVEVNPGRVEIRDYDRIIEKANQRVGVADVSTLPVKQGVNAYGQTFTYVEGLQDTGDPTDGGYFIEEDRRDTLTAPCWFTLSTGQIFSLKNPEYASESMMRYISEKVAHLYETLLSGGVNPVDGTLLSEEMDLTAFARFAYLQELLINYDGCRYSFYFVLDAGETVFTPGPVWDLDNTLLRTATTEKSATSFWRRGKGEMLYYLYQLPQFRQAFREASEEITPLVENILLGEEKGEVLQPLTTLAGRIESSQRMNRRLHFADRYRSEYYPEYWRQQVERLGDLFTERAQWLRDYAHSDFDSLDLALYAPWGQIRDFRFNSCEPFLASVEDFHMELVEEADEENFARYEFTAKIQTVGEMTVRGVTVNGVPFPLNVEEDGSFTLHGYAQDPSYRPVDYEGEDVGLYYEEAAFRQNYPELSEEYEDDSEGLLAYFMEEGIYEGLKGNAFLDPQEIYMKLDDVADPLGESWDLYYTEYVESGRDLWMLLMESYVLLPVEVAP